MGRLTDPMRDAALTHAVNKAFSKPGPYRTELNPDEESAFRAWVEENKGGPPSIGNFDPEDDKADYDLRGFWKGAVSGDKRAVVADNGHIPDVWKTPYHHTFSNESVYATPDAPRWKGSQLVNKKGEVVYDEAKVSER